MFKFTLYDFTNSDGSTGVEIVEPIGFDALTTKLIRNPLYKGVLMEFSDVEIQVDDKQGYKIITNAYNKLGVNAHVEIRIEYKCNHSGKYEELFYGRIGFKAYSQKCEDYCAAIVNIEPSSCVVEWKFREDVKVDLKGLKAFDGVTDLVPYEKLGFEVEMPSKTIVLTDRATHDKIEGYENDIPEYKGYPIRFAENSENHFSKYVILPFPDVLIDEIPTFQPQVDVYNIYKSNPDNFPEDLATFINTTGNSINVNLKGRIVGIYEATGLSDTITQSLAIIVNVQNKNGNIVSTPYSNVFATPNSSWVEDLAFDITIDENIILNQDDRIFIFLYKDLNSYNQVNNAHYASLLVKNDESNFVQLKHNSTFASTPCKQFMINEVLSRITENTTNGCMRVYSDFFGRTDAQPYPSDTDGCGGLTSITNGLFLRQIEKVRDENTQPVFAVSFKEAFEALDAIYNIGLQIEDDPNRQGHQLVRIESEDYFYQDEIMLDLGNVWGEIQIRPDEIYNIIKFGYDKWEAEEYNGLDEFLTKREYKMDMVVKKEFNKLSKFIASGYTIEITRRKGVDTTKDWRYDNDTFIVCLKRESGALKVEHGAIANPENIIDPPTLYNVRISPLRNAMRWIKNILQSFRQIDSNSKIEFTSGDGNYFAKGKYTGACVLEENEISESQTIDQSIFADESLVIPYTKAELIKLLDIPISFKNYKEIRSNPLRLIKMRICGKEILAYVQKMEYSFTQGTADLELLPKF